VRVRLPPLRSFFSFLVRRHSLSSLFFPKPARPISFPLDSRPLSSFVHRPASALRLSLIVCGAFCETFFFPFGPFGHSRWLINSPPNTVKILLARQPPFYFCESEPFLRWFLFSRSLDFLVMASSEILLGSLPPRISFPALVFSSSAVIPQETLRISVRLRAYPGSLLQRSIFPCVF